MALKIGTGGSLVSWQAAPGLGECRHAEGLTSFSFPWRRKLWTQSRFSANSSQFITSCTDVPV